MKFVILSGGYPPSEKLLKHTIAQADKLIGVDGAADFLTGYGITANFLIGDFDTAKKKSVQIQHKEGAKVVRLETRKNLTDTEAALELAIENGAKEIVFLGALGSRQDHTQANITLLKKAYESKVSAKILDDNNEILITEGELELSSFKGQTISIIPLCCDIRVTARGLEYPLENLLLRFGSSRGVSNIMKEDKANIYTDGGYALIILSDSRL